MGKAKKEVIGIIGTTSGVDELVSQLEAIDKTAGDQIEALRKQAVTIAEQMEKTKHPLWSALATVCGRDNDWREKEQLGYDLATKAVYSKPLRNDGLGGLITAAIDALRCKDPACKACNSEGES